MSAITAAFLIDIANSCCAPAHEPDDGAFGDREFLAKDGWKVVVFYDSGDLDYIDSFVSPSGEKIDMFGAGRDALIDDPDWPALQNWDPPKVTAGEVVG